MPDDFDFISPRQATVAWLTGALIVAAVLSTFFLAGRFSVENTLRQAAVCCEGCP